MIAAHFDMLPEELLYSSIARYQVRLALPAPKAFLEHLHGQALGVAVVDLPSRIDHLLRRMGPDQPYAPEDVIRRHTLLPYYARFLPAERLQRVENAMHGSGGAEVYAVLGLRASGVTSPKHLNFCPSCAAEDLEEFGAAVWRRVHQVPGVLICAAHARALYESNHLRSPGADRRAFHALDAETIEKGRPLEIPPGSHASVESLARDCAWLLANPAGAGDPSSQLDAHRRLASDAGLAAAGGKKRPGYVRIAAIRKHLERHHTPRFLDAIGCAVAQDDADDWLARLLRSPRGASHPLHHLLFLGFVGVSAAEFLTAGAPVTPRAVRQTPHPARAEPGRARGKRLSPTPDWEQRLRLLVTTTELTLQQIADALGTSRVTVQKHARRIGVWRPEWKGLGSRGSVPVEERRRLCRERWLSARREHPDFGRSALAALLGADATWLFRHDRAWYDENSPEKHQHVGGGRLVDWRARDEACLGRAKSVVEAVRTEEVPRRVTLSLLLKALGLAETMRRSADQLPRTSAYLNEQVESPEAWAERRLSWAVHTCIRSGRIPSPSALIGIAKLRYSRALYERALELVETIKSALTRPS